MTATTEYDDPTGESGSEQRFETWRDLISLTRECKTSTPHVDDFTADLRRLELGPVTFLGSTFPSSRFQRTAAQVRSSDLSVFHITLVLEGGLGLVLPDGSGFTAGPGEFSVLDSSRPYDLRAFGPGGPGRPRVKALGIDFPSALLPVPPNRLRRLLGRYQVRPGTLQLVSDFLHNLNRQGGTLGRATADRLGPIMVDLVSAWLAEEMEAEQSLSPEARRRVLVQNVRAFVQRHLHDPELTPSAIAEAHHISLSYLHRVFTEESDGETLAAWIRGRRLARAHHDLADPALRDTPIHVLAARCGIPRPDDFSRAFRSTYGLSPREHRRAALDGGLP
ncbi:AraC family transcriptional regulator [Kitasatospora sp. NPDC057198]|uniref:AraC family transcriptional regulator n=1 Tax=Kitasatospora sp. NPDC057198 TaxID=3346046 RepID=UPI00362B56E1